MSANRSEADGAVGGVTDEVIAEAMRCKSEIAESVRDVRGSFWQLLTTLDVDLKNTYVAIGYGDCVSGVSPVATNPVISRRIILTCPTKSQWCAVDVIHVPGNSYDLGVATHHTVLYEFMDDFVSYMVDTEFENHVTLSKAQKLEISTCLDEFLGDQSSYWTLWSVEDEPDDIAEIFGQWLQPDDVIEMYSPPRVVSAACARGLKATLSIDLETGYDLCQPQVREQVRQELRKRRPRFLLTCPPCTKFSPLQNLRRDRDGLLQELEEATVHLDFSMEMQEEQLQRGDHGLHEHPDTATSWNLPSVKDSLAHDEVILVKSHQCRFGLQVQDKPNRKSTLFATTCDAIAVNLQKLCQCTEPHQPLMSGLPRLAQEYPPELVKAILDGLMQDWLDQQRGRPERLPDHGDLAQWCDELGRRNTQMWRDFHGSAVLVAKQAKSIPITGPGHRSVRWTWVQNPIDGKWIQFEQGRSGKARRFEVPYDFVVALYCHPEICLDLATAEPDQVTNAEKNMILRAHVNLGHPRVKEFVRLLKAAGTRDDIINYVIREFHCEGCLKEERQPTRLPASTPRTYDFNVVIGVDVLFVFGHTAHDELPVLNITCLGTLYSTFTLIDAKRRTSGLVWKKFLSSWLRVFGSPSFVIMGQGLEFQGEFIEGIENHGIQPILIDRDAPYQNGITERRGGLFKEVYYRTRELQQPQSISEVEDMIHEVSWALQTMTNRSGYSPAQRVFGRQPTIAMELINDAGQYEVPQTMDQAWRRSEEIRQAAKKALVEVDGRERLQRAIRARPRRAREEKVFAEGDPVYVWRQGRRGSTAKVGPCFVVLRKGDTIWVTRRGELWKCNKTQVFSMGNLEKQGLEAIPAELLKAKERLRFHPEKLGYVDVQLEGDPPDDEAWGEASETIQRRAPATPRVPATPAAPATPRASAVPATPKMMARSDGPPEGLESPSPQTTTTTSAKRPVPVQESDLDKRQRTTAADELWKAVIENQQARDLDQTPSSSAERPEGDKVYKAWSRYDAGAKRFRGSNAHGPLWADVVRRITIDLDAVTVIQDRVVTPGMPVHQLHEKLPPQVSNIETILIYQQVPGHPDPGQAFTAEIFKGVRQPLPLLMPNEDARLVDTGMKRSLEEQKGDERAAHRSRVFGTWIADDLTEWGDKREFPVVANSRDLI